MIECDNYFIAFYVFDLDETYMYLLIAAGRDGSESEVVTVLATSGQGPDRPQEVSYTAEKLIGNGSFGLVYQAKLCDTGELIAIKRVLQDKRFKVIFVFFFCSHVYSVINSI